MTNEERFITEKEAAKLCALKLQTLRNWRHKRIGPPYCKLNNRAVRYYLPDFRKYFEAHTIYPEKAE